MTVTPRACRVEELSELVRLANRVFRPRGGYMAAEYPLEFNAANCEQLRVIEVDGRLVSHVGLSIRDAFLGGIALRVASVGGVCTAPEHRGQGFATALMADAAEHARSRGAQLMLISGGRGLYHRLGYVTVGAFRRTAISTSRLATEDTEGTERDQRAAGSQVEQVQVGTRLEPSNLQTGNSEALSVSSVCSVANSKVDVSPFTPADLEAVMALHRGEVVRFVRPAEDWEALLRAGMLMNRAAVLFVVRQAGEPVAYMGVQKPVPDREGRLQPARVWELAGSRWAIAAALPQAAAQLGAEAIEVAALAADGEWASIARAQGWELQPVAFPGTLGILDPPAFFAALERVMAERLGEASPLRVDASLTGVRFTLAGSDEAYEVAAPGPLAALVFGGETAEAKSIPPLAGEISREIAKLFPLPLLWYGYNYV